MNLVRQLQNKFFSLTESKLASAGVSNSMPWNGWLRVGKHFRHNLSQISLLQRDQCDYFSLFMPDLIANPWKRQEPHLGYRLAKPMYAGPNRLWGRSRIWRSQGS